jgi:hypothetical protein
MVCGWRACGVVVGEEGFSGVDKNWCPIFFSTRRASVVEHYRSQYTCRSCNSNIDVEERGELGEEHLKL